MNPACEHPLGQYPEHDLIIRILGPNLEQRGKRLDKAVSRIAVHLVLERREHILVGSAVLDGDVGAENVDERLGLDLLAVDREEPLGVAAAGLLPNLLDRIAFGKGQKKVFRDVDKGLIIPIDTPAHPALRLPIVKEPLSLFLCNAELGCSLEIGVQIRAFRIEKPIEEELILRRLRHLFFA